MTEQLGRTEHQKELDQWNRPYTYQQFPQALYMGTTTTAGLVQLIHPPRIVTSEQEAQDALSRGWCVNPQSALDAETKRQEAIGTAAAERAYTDRQMSASAQAEAAEADQAAGATHLGEIPERPRSHRKKPEATP
jgi:hypothetical protein